MPLIWPIAVVAAVGLFAASPWVGRATAVNAAIAAVVPAVVLIPWTFHLFTSASAFFLEAGVQRPGLASAGLRPESVLLLSPGGPGLPPAWVTAGLVLPAFCALLARKRMPVVYAGWVIALGGLVVALVVSRVRVTVPGGTAISAWPGVATAVAAAGLLLAATPLIEAAGLALGRTARSPRRPPVPGGWRGLAVLGGVAVAASAPVLAAGYWLTAGVRGPVTAAGPQILPPFVASSSSGPRPDQDAGPAAGRRGPVLHGPAQHRPRARRARADRSLVRHARAEQRRGLAERRPPAVTAGTPGRRSASSTSATCCCPPRSIRRSPAS